MNETNKQEFSDRIMSSKQEWKLKHEIENRCTGRKKQKKGKFLRKFKAFNDKSKTRTELSYNILLSKSTTDIVESMPT